MVMLDEPEKRTSLRAPVGEREAPPPTPPTAEVAFDVRNLRVSYGALRRRIIDEVLAIELRDNVDARELQPDGTYALPPRAAGEESFTAQKYFMTAASVRTVAANEAASAAAAAS